MTKWLKRMAEYWRDKKLAEKCGLHVKDVCVHESDGNYYWDNERFPEKNKCIKCGSYYE